MIQKETVETKTTKKYDDILIGETFKDDRFEYLRIHNGCIGYSLTSRYNDKSFFPSVHKNIEFDPIKLFEMTNSILTFSNKKD